MPTKKSKKQPSTLLVFVQDETGSMFERREQTVSAFNEYFVTLRKNSKDFGKVTVHAWQFSATMQEDWVRSLHEGELEATPILDDANYRPRGVTPLLDAVGTAIQKADKDRADRVLFIVQTDGLENASKDFTREQVAKLVSEKEADPNWTLVFLGEGIANWTAEASKMGVAITSSLQYVPAQAQAVYRGAATASAAFLASDALSDREFTAKVESKVASES